MADSADGLINVVVNACDEGKKNVGKLVSQKLRRMPRILFQKKYIITYQVGSLILVLSSTSANTRRDECDASFYAPPKLEPRSLNIAHLSEDFQLKLVVGLLSGGRELASPVLSDPTQSHVRRHRKSLSLDPLCPNLNPHVPPSR